MRSGNKTRLFITDFISTLFTHQKATHFISRHKLWKGLGDYGWFFKLLMGVAIIVGLALFGTVWNWWERADMHNVAEAAHSFSTLFSDVFKEGYDFLFMGSFKYIIMVVMEILLFHVTRRTMEIKTGNKYDLSFKSFLAAERRMIAVVFFAFLAETILIGITKGVLGAVGVESLRPVASILIQCYFLGFVVVDNYNELYSMTIKESEKVTREFGGVAIGIGLVTYLLLMIPLIGAVVAPFVGAVTATLVMHGLRDEHQMYAEQKVEWV